MTIEDRSWGDESAGISVRDVLTVVFRRRRLIIAPAVIGLAVAVAVVLLREPIYVVSADLLVSKARAEVPLTPTESRQVLTDVSDKDLNSEVEVLKSRQLIETVLRSLGAGETPTGADDSFKAMLRWMKASARAVLGKPELSPFEQLTIRVQKNLSITSLPRSNVIRVSFTSKQPEFATRFVRELTETYIEDRVERYQSPQVVAFFENQMTAAEERLREKEGALEEILSAAQLTMTNGIQGGDALEGQKTVLLDRLARFQNDLGDSEAKVQQLEQTIESIRQRMETEPERLQSPDRNLEDPAQEIIKQRLADLTLQRDALLQDFKPDSRYVRDINTQIELAQQRLAQLEADDVTLHGTEVNPIHRGLKAKLLEVESEYDGEVARYQSLKTLVSQYQSELDELNDKAFQIEGLRREAEAAEQEYLLYRKKFEEARISAAMDRQRLINVSIAEPAQRPLQPVGRGVMSILSIGLLGGLVSGVLLAFAFDMYIDKSFTTGRDVERSLGIVHLASIPEGAE